MKYPLVPAFAMSAVVLVTLAGCATKPAVIAEAPPPPATAPVVVAMPKGAYVGMAIPARLPDGRYATPNRDLTPDATIWHFRVALNVAALACRGEEGDRIVAGYNSMLTREKAPLAAAETHYAAEFKATGTKDWRATYDNGMTRLYNFFSQSPARDAFCDAAAATLADAALVDDAGLSGFAAIRLAVLERPFTDFYAAYDAWRESRSRPIYALAATTAPGPAATARPPRLELDPSVFQDTTVTH
ncbi:hypothetical protein [Sphingomonas oligophenolica]|uniref:Uncharacterized protein n=1 Tax=Sphingomonas oligophenolica TaxID=301154 RepID=A0A502CSC1_9SPHN|nr:hypothetical protein [Sphingomonas oligophenolica]TPG15743.1 hypothetical protein EAH84_01405 [Sphingomonas oligophenolica]